MKFYTKLLTLLIFSCCFALPSSAWEQSFEGHPDDFPLESIYFPTSSSMTQSNFNHGSALYGTGGSYKSMSIMAPYNGYLAFTAQTTGGAGTIDIEFRVNQGGNVVYGKTLSNVIPDDGKPHRVELIEIEQNAMMVLEVDGVIQGTAVQGTAITPEFLSINVGSTGGMYIDDFSTRGAEIFTDTTAEKLRPQYYSCGYEITENVSWYTTVSAPTGNTIYQYFSGAYFEQYGTHFAEIEIPTDFHTSNGAGKYVIKLYQETAEGFKSMEATKVYTYDPEGSDLITTDKKDYYPGEQIVINTYAPQFEGYTVSVPYYDNTGQVQTYSYSLTTDDQIHYFTLPQTSRGGSFVIYMRDSEGAVKAGTSYNSLGVGGLSDVRTDKTLYSLGETAKIYYEGMPSGTTITARIQHGDTLVSTREYPSLTGSGVLSLPLPSSNADYISITAAKGDIFLGTATANIRSGVFYLSGHIIDPSDGSTIPGASIQIGTSTTTSDERGAYNFSVPAGWQDLQISKIGYQSNTNKVNIVYPVATQDFYLVKSYTGEGHSIYGIVTDYYTGAPVSSALITLTQGEISHTLFSYTGSGYYIYDAEDMIGEWNIKVTKSGYYPYVATITVSNDIYKQIILTPTKYNAAGDTGSNNEGGDTGGDTNGDTGGSGSDIDGDGIPDIDDTGVSQDRPGRQAAKDSMDTLENAVPGLIGMVVLRVFLELVKF